MVNAFRLRLDLAKLWNGIEKSITDINPAAKGALNLLFENAGKDKDPSFDLRKELFGNLGDDIVVYGRPPTGTTPEEFAKPRTLFLIGSPAADRLANAIETLVGALVPDPSFIKKRDLLGRKIRAIEMGPGSKLEFTSSAGYLAVTSDPAILEQFLRSAEAKAKPLREAEGLAAATEKVGGNGTGMFGYQDQKAETRVALELARKAAAEGGGDPFEELPDFGFRGAFNYKLHPAFDQVAKYFGFAVYSGQVTADGFRLRFYGPTPAGGRK